MTRHNLLIVLLFMLSSCTWVELTAEGEGVTLMEPSAIQNCQRIGRVTSRTTDEIVSIDRSSEKLQNELVTLARNEAGAMGGNAIVPESIIQDGSQVFGVYTCP